jgi:hypothetical protein
LTLNKIKHCNYRFAWNLNILQIKEVKLYFILFCKYINKIKERFPTKYLIKAFSWHTRSIIAFYWNNLNKTYKILQFIMIKQDFLLSEMLKIASNKTFKYKELIKVQTRCKQGIIRISSVNKKYISNKKLLQTRIKKHKVNVIAFSKCAFVCISV